MRLAGLFFLDAALFSVLELACRILSALSRMYRGSFYPLYYVARNTTMTCCWFKLKEAFKSR